MKITADTNVLVRALTGDDPKQSRIAQAALDGAEAVAVAIPTLCELVWVLSAGYGLARVEIVEAIARLLDTDKVVVNRAQAEAGLAVTAAGGDFADGAIAYEGRWLGGGTFVSFDKKAVRLLEARGEPARLLA